MTEKDRSIFGEFTPEQFLEVMKGEYFDEQLLRKWLTEKREMSLLTQLPPSLSFSIQRRFYNVIIPTNDVMYTCIDNLDHYPMVVSEDLMGVSEILNHLLMDEYKERKVISVALRRLLMETSNHHNDYPYILEVTVGNEQLTLSFLNESFVDMDPLEWTEKYVDHRILNGSYDRKSLDERHEDGPTNSSDEMFKEVGNSLQEAIQEVKETPLAEHIEGGMGDDGRYVVKTFRQFHNREEYLDYMRKVMDL
ncbi:hypothetical protein FDJ25_gp138 [Vibrio phage Aphrodite1]|uniref:Uncharacterized protein n=1 Tax=Vibrio phage Aphrodite1 TaxID=2070057 RepID=A0A2I7QI08_9CAUD|nr:hypothetical protein FDJ25_gp138 [Vibrio phage Aphrodite1]AUR81008.1 hypothetical protein Aphrodite1_0063 [Vibrio phage Aphrodite1]